jgi:hypothetical protein
VPEGQDPSRTLRWIRNRSAQERDDSRKTPLARGVLHSMSVPARQPGRRYPARFEKDVTMRSVEGTSIPVKSFAFAVFANGLP